MADALSKPDPTLWRLRPRAPMPGTVLCPLDDIPDGDAKEYRVRARHHGVLDVRRAARRRASTATSTSARITPRRSTTRAGQFLSDDKSHIRCTMHFAEFRIEDGYGVRGAAERCWLDPVPVHVENGAIVISTLADQA